MHAQSVERNIELILFVVNKKRVFLKTVDNRREKSNISGVGDQGSGFGDQGFRGRGSGVRLKHSNYGGQKIRICSLGQPHRLL